LLVNGSSVMGRDDPPAVRSMSERVDPAFQVGNTALMRRVHRGRVVLALAAWLLPWAGAAATGLHLAFDDHHLAAPIDSALPASIHGTVHTHDAPAQAPAIAVDAAPRLRPAQSSSLAVVALAAFDVPRLSLRPGFAGRTGPGPDPPHLATGHSILRI
jgi:hypothetical protein